MTTGPFDAPAAGPSSPPPPPPQVPPAPAAPPPVPPPYVLPQPRKRGAWRVLSSVLLVISVLANIGLLLAVAGLAAMVAPGFTGESFIEERVVEAGPAGQKIAVIRIEGLLDEEMTERISPMLDRAAKDHAVKAVILRIDSPGGGITASDTLHHKIESVRDEGKKIVTAMGGVAASGGYYIACGSDHIVAQPTTITGSIGIIAEFFFLNTLMKDKLGVTCVTLKIGEKKDWPNMFGASDITPEQRQYFMESLLQPGFDRFIDVVTEGRGLKREEVLALATGQVYGADEAKKKKLVDEIGYFEAAVDAAKELAQIPEARVVEYHRPPTLADLMGLGIEAKAALDMRPEKISALASPRIMYLWKGF